MYKNRLKNYEEEPDSKIRKKISIEQIIFRDSLENKKSEYLSLNQLKNEKKKQEINQKKEIKNKILTENVKIMKLITYF